MTCQQCRGWMLEERRMDFSPETYVWRCISCASIADPWTDQRRIERKHMLVETVKILH